MRNELELIEKIGQYLDGRLANAERALFEQQLAQDPALQEAVVLQQQILEGMERTVLKQHIQQARLRFRKKQLFRKGGAAGFLLLILAGIFYYSSTNIKPGNTSHSSPAEQHSPVIPDTGEQIGIYSDHLPAHNESGKQIWFHSDSLPVHNESGEQLWAEADKNLMAQAFLLDAARDTVIETNAGIILSVPAYCFLDNNNKPISGTVELVIKEALDVASIMKAGLSSKSGDELLESGGMFFVDARQKEHILKIDPKRGIYAEIPADTVKPGMQLFTGKRLATGTIDWTDPRPLEHDLVSLTIGSLNFYPPQYLDSLRQWGYDSRNKQFTDSLYYSFSQFFTDKPVLIPELPTLDHAVGDTVTRTTPLPTPACGINPAKIKTIWNTHFQNTLLSTREFEERLSWIHRSANNAILDLYVNNLDKNLSEIDSMAARLLNSELDGRFKEKFLSFYARHDGKVKNGSTQFQLLRNYYQMKAKAFAAAIIKTQNDYWNKQAALDQVAYRLKAEHDQDSIHNVTQNLREEFDINLKNAFKQLGYDTTVSLRLPAKNTYRVNIINMGWCNIDRAVYASTVSRTTLDFTDTKTGRRAIIRYLPASFEIAQFNTFDRLYVYLLPDRLSSYMRLTSSTGQYSEKLDELMKYNFVCIGYKNEQAFFYSQENIQPKAYTSILLTEIEEKALDKQLKSLAKETQVSGLKKEQAFFVLENLDMPRRMHNKKLKELKNRLLKLLFACAVDSGNFSPKSLMPERPASPMPE
jgi:hypothetical protein